MFKSYIQTFDYTSYQLNPEKNPINLFTITEDNLDGILVLMRNCIKYGISSQDNIRIATVHPSLWLGDWVDTYYKYISYVTNDTTFKVSRILNNQLVVKSYSCYTKKLSEDEVSSFFETNKFKKFVIYFVTKNVELSSLKTYYQIKFADISEKFEERDSKIIEILEK